MRISIGYKSSILFKSNWKVRSIETIVSWTLFHHGNVLLSNCCIPGDCEIPAFFFDV